MFGQKLSETVKGVGGGIAAILMGFDGIPVDSHMEDESMDVETLGMEFSVILKEVRKVAVLLDVGNADELVVKADKLATVVRAVNEEYFVALFMTPDGNLGKARYLLRVLTPLFRAEL